MLARALALGDATPPTHGGPNRAHRRKQLQNWCRVMGVPYAVAREDIRKEEAKMRAAGIDPWAPKKHLMPEAPVPALDQATTNKIVQEAESKGVEIPDIFSPENL